MLQNELKQIGITVKVEAMQKFTAEQTSKSQAVFFRGS
jgi:hypothetical protein